MKKYIPLFAALLLLVSCGQKSRIDSLLSEMTLEEKIGQLNQLTGDHFTGAEANSDQEQKIRDGQVGSMLNVSGAAKVRRMQKIAVEESRMGIPIIFGLDVIHGYHVTFPIPLAMSCTWDTQAIEQACRIAATEASASGIAWTFTPMCDIARDARWGRIAEGAGEDPYLGGAVAAAQVRGFQGDLTDSTNIAACLKHFALYGAPVAGKDYGAVEMSRQQMFNEYLYPYKAAVDAGALTAMSSFNEFESLPLTVNKYMLTDVLRDFMGFKGMLVTDYAAIKECIEHGVVADMYDGACRAIDAGVDMDMVDEAFVLNLAKAVKDGRVSEKKIDTACRRVLELKERLGLFDDPYKFCREEEEARYMESEEFLPFARKISAESIVLLKNENNVLPLKEGKRIAVIGPLGNLPREMLGTWDVGSKPSKGGRLDYPVSLYEGLCNRYGKDKVSCAMGCRVFDDEDVVKKLVQSRQNLQQDRSEASLMAEAMLKAAGADVIIAAMGELAYMSGEGCSRTDITIPRPQRELLRKLVATGKPVILVTLAGRPLVLDWESENVPAIVNAWHLGYEAGNAIADVLSGDVNPSGRLTASFPRCVGQIPVFYNHKNSGRPNGEKRPYKRFENCYCDVINAPLYPFGYGLSYSSIKYSGLTLSADSLSVAAMPLEVKVTLTNESDRDADEVAQLYIRDVTASSTRPVKELKGFSRVTVPAGQSVELSFSLSARDLGFYNHELQFVTEPGVFDIMVGPWADDDVLQKKSFMLL